MFLFNRVNCSSVFQLPNLIFTLMLRMLSNILMITLKAMDFSGCCRTGRILLLTAFRKLLLLVVWPFALLHYLLGRFLLMQLRLVYDEQFWLIYYMSVIRDQFEQWHDVMQQISEKVYYAEIHFLDFLLLTLSVTLSVLYAFCILTLKTYFKMRQMVYIVALSLYAFFGFRYHVPVIIFKSLC